MKRSLLIGAGAILIAAVTVVIVMLVVRSGTEPPESFGPWYPLANQDGDPAVRDFEGHVPCAIDDPPAADCQRVKFGIVLYRDAASGEPTTYLMSIVRVGVGDERETHEGTWSEARGTGLDPDATVYRLDSGAPDHLRGYWPIGDDLLFLLDEEGMPRVGDAAYGYVLNSIPIGQRVEAPR